MKFIYLIDGLIRIKQKKKNYYYYYYYYCTGILYSNLDEFQQTIVLRNIANGLREKCIIIINCCYFYYYYYLLILNI